MSLTFEFVYSQNIIKKENELQKNEKNIYSCLNNKCF